jgi:fucose permease
MSAHMTIRSMSGPAFAVAWPAVLIVYAAALLQGMTLVSFPAVSAMLKQALSLSDADYGAIFLPQVALAIVGAIAGGVLARTIGLKALLALALAANAASQVLLAASDFASPSGGLVLLFVGTASLGLGFGLIGGPINAYPGLLFPRHGQTAIVAAHTLIGLGLATGPLIAGLFVAAGAWSGFPISLASACAIAAIAGLLIRLPQSEARVAGDEPAATRPAASPTFWLFGAITVIYAFAEGIFSSWAVIFLRDGKGLPDMTASYALSAFWGSLVGGRLLVSVLIVRVPAKIVWITLPVLMIAAFWFVSFADSAATGIGAFAFAGLACSAFLPLTISLAVDRFADSVAWVSSMLIAGLMTGAGVGTWLVGALQVSLPLDTLYRLSSLYPILVLALAWLVLRSSPRTERKRSAPVPA